MKKKAQLEMIGIAIVVVLVVLGFLFVLKAMSKPPIDTQASFLRTHISQDVLNTMSITDASCGGIDMTELLKACAEGASVECGEPCAYFNDSMKMVLKLTLDEQNLPYRLRVYTTDEPPLSPRDTTGSIFIEGLGCNEDSLKTGRYAIKEKPGMIIIPSKAGDIKMMLEICSKPY